MGTIIGFFVSKGLSEKAARALSYVGLFLLIGGTLLGLKLAYDHRLIANHDLKNEVKVQKKLQPANDHAANDRAANTIAINQTETEAHNAIHSVPDAAPAAPSVRLGCDRLRRAGNDISRVPACAGYSSGR